MELDIKGAKILFEIEAIGLKITETQVNSWIIMLVIAVICIILTRNLKVKSTGKRQIIAEYLVNATKSLVDFNMGEKFKSFTPFIAALLSLSLFSSLSSLLTMYPPTADLNTTLGWALVSFILITYYKIKTNRASGYLKEFTKPIFVMTPFNVISEIATPVSMAFRHFGNVATGVVISTLLYAALELASSLVVGWLPGVLGNIPLLQLGVPAVLSIYFDLFSSAIQAYIFCMLTMIYIGMATETDQG